jgi:hypothetical protein
MGWITFWCFKRRIEHEGHQGRTLLRENTFGVKQFTQRLKPQCFLVVYGTAEAVPFRF